MKKRTKARVKEKVTVTGQGAQPSHTPDRTQTPDPKIDKDLELRRDGPEDELEL